MHHGCISDEVKNIRENFGSRYQIGIETLGILTASLHGELGIIMEVGNETGMIEIGGKREEGRGNCKKSDQCRKRKKDKEIKNAGAPWLSFSFAFHLGKDDISFSRNDPSIKYRA